jgi:soluble lytic murein transglycosylase-like protein
MISTTISTTTRPHPPARRRSARRTGMVVGLVGATLVLVGSPAVATDGDLPGGRRIVDHTVRSGETATGLAVRYHAWTAELIDHNHLGSSAGLRVGQHLEIPVVVAALPHRRPAVNPAATPAARPRPHHAAPPAHRAGNPGTATVRRAVAGAAAHQGVDPQLALAVSWQESGWQMDRTSGAGAIGAMQVLPATARWMELYAGRDLHLHHLHDNATAGATLLRVLGSETRSTRHAVAAYYQGLGAVREHGLYGETRAYVADVSAIRRRLEAGRSPS